MLGIPVASNRAPSGFGVLAPGKNRQNQTIVVVPARARIRHSTVELTMQYYTKLGIDDLESHGIELLPGVEKTITKKFARGS